MYGRRAAKDSVVNLMGLLAGSYSYTVNYTTLCEAPQGDGPSQSLAMIRARSIVSARETPAGENIRFGQTYTNACVTLL